MESVETAKQRNDAMKGRKYRNAQMYTDVEGGKSYAPTKREIFLQFVRIYKMAGVYYWLPTYGNFLK